MATVIVMGRKGEVRSKKELDRMGDGLALRTRKGNKDGYVAGYYLSNPIEAVGGL